MTVYSIGLVAILTLFSSLTFAYTPEEGKVTAVIGPFFYKTNFGAIDSKLSSPWLGDPAIIANGDINKNGSLEIAIFHLNKVYLRESFDTQLIEQTELIHITLGYRHWFNSSFSGSLGFFSAYSMGESKILYNDTLASAGINTSAKDTTEYGFDFAIQSEIWNFSKFSIVMDARYSLSVTSKINEKADHWGALIGIKYLVQEKYQDTKKSNQ